MIFHILIVSLPPASATDQAENGIKDATRSTVQNAAMPPMP
jgi:hypothetical protein